uniref:CTLH domain-containing protein n=1 Tax=Kalanchoe fedtschenkoi TaxID=63787 RepID=A0A7N0V3Q4_KALFE
MEPEYNDFDAEADHFSGYIDSDFFEADAGPVDADNGAEEPDDSSFDYNPTLSKSVLWDQEAALLGFLFKNYERKVESISRQAELGSMLSAIAVEIMSFMSSDQERLSRVRDRLSILKELMLQVPQIMEGLNGAVDDFQSGLEHIKSGWATQRLDRSILTYLLRMRYMKTALVFAKRRHMMDLFPIEPFREERQIVEALRNKTLEPALKWCSINARGSWFHFNLECQKYIELVRHNADKTLVIKCAKKLAEEFWDSYEDDLLHILPALAFGCKTEVHRYKKLFDADRWDLLETLFKHKFNLTHKFTQISSSLWILMEAGMIALKVPYPYD